MSFFKEITSKMREVVGDTLSNFSLPSEHKNLIMNRLPSSLSEAAQGWSFLLPGTSINYAAKAGNPLYNSAISATIGWISGTFPEAPIRVLKRNTDGIYIEEFDHDMVDLIEMPNKFYDGKVLWIATITSDCLSGNSYWLKRRNLFGEVVELWYLPHYQVSPYWELTSNNYIDYYRYFPENSEPQIIVPKDIIHFRNTLDESNNRLGISPIQSLFREIFVDNEANNFAASLLTNMGVPGCIISPENGASFIKTDAETIKERFAESFTRDNRGKPLVMSAGIKITPIGLNPQQLDLKLLHRLPEERITAVFGIPAVVAGLGAGLETSGSASYKEARQEATESKILPMYARFAAVLKTDLLTEFLQVKRELTLQEIRKTLKGYKVEFDSSGIRVLQDDESSKFLRYNQGVANGWITPNEARARCGLPSIKGGENLLSKNQNALTAARGDIIPDKNDFNTQQTRNARQEQTGSPKAKPDKKDLFLQNVESLKDLVTLNVYDFGLAQKVFESREVSSDLVKAITQKSFYHFIINRFEDNYVKSSGIDYSKLAIDALLQLKILNICLHSEITNSGFGLEQMKAISLLEANITEQYHLLLSEISELPNNPEPNLVKSKLITIFDNTKSYYIKD